MFFVWRGWGFLGLAVLLPAVASCGGLIEYSPVLANAAAGATLLGGGLTCLRYGRRWNQATGFHSMYWLPLEYWGLLYTVLGGLLVAIVTVGSIWRLVVGRPAG